MAANSLFPPLPSIFRDGCIVIIKVILVLVVAGIQIVIVVLLLPLLALHFAGELVLIAKSCRRPAVHDRNRCNGLPLLFALALDIEHGKGGVAMARLLVNLLQQHVNLLEALRDDRHVIDELTLNDAAGQIWETGHHERNEGEIAEGPKTRQFGL